MGLYAQDNVANVYAITLDFTQIKLAVGYFNYFFIFEKTEKTNKLNKKTNKFSMFPKGI